MIHVLFLCVYFFVGGVLTSPVIKSTLSTKSPLSQTQEALFLQWIEGKLVARSPGIGYKFSHEANAWLRLHTTPASWPDAERQCRLEGGALAAPTTRALAKSMLTMMTVEELKDGVFTSVAATLRSQFQVPKIQAQPSLGPAGYTVMFLLRVDTSNDTLKPVLRNEDYCVVFTIEGLMDYIPCSSERPFFCLKSPNQCPAGYSWSSRTTHCYKVHVIPQTWHSAAKTCRDEEGHLAIINSDHEQEVLKDLFESHKDEVIGNNAVAMIGFWKWDNAGEWMTVHGETLGEAGFDKWAEGQPDNAGGNENCGSIIRKTGLLNDLPCNKPFAFICEINPNANINK